MQIKQISSLICVVIGITGCASMFGDNTRQVAVNSQPMGASIYMDGKSYGTTPANITLPNYVYGGKTITLKHAGYADQELQINTAFQNAGLWNILNLPIGFIIDGADGNMVKVAPTDTNITTTLQPLQATAAPVVSTTPTVAK